MSTEQQNKAVVGGIYAAFGRGDLPAVLQALADDVLWEHPRPREIPWGGRRQGKEQVAAFFAALADTVAVEDLHVDRQLAEGDCVVALGHERMRVKRSARTYANAWVHVWILRAGRVVAFAEHADTATIAEALR